MLEIVVKLYLDRIMVKKKKKENLSLCTLSKALIQVVKGLTFLFTVDSLDL